MGNIPSTVAEDVAGYVVAVSHKDGDYGADELVQITKSAA
jgi:hypothetical protein